MKNYLFYNNKLNIMIIGICGLQGSGKDTLGNIFETKYGFKKLSYASILKDIVSVLFGWDRNMIEGATIESRKWREQIDEWWAKRLDIPNLTPRYILQFFGTDLFRTHFHSEIWVAAVERQLSKYKNVVITDCRFPNEIQMIQSYGAKMIMIQRGELPEWFNKYKENYIDKPDGIHPSEYMWIKNNFNYTYQNDSSLEELEKFADSIIT
jgi:hypothetical protein